MYAIKLTGKRRRTLPPMKWSMPGYLTRAGHADRVVWTNDCKRDIVALFDTHAEALQVCEGKLGEYVHEIVRCCPDHPPRVAVIP